MQACICDSCGKVVTDNSKIYLMRMENIKIQHGFFYKDLCDECFNKMQNTFFKDQED